MAKYKLSNTSREWLIELRKKHNLSQQKVANRAGIHRATYGQLETGLRNPSVGTAQKIALVLGFDWTIFFAYNRCDKHQNDVDSLVG